MGQRGYLGWCGVSGPSAAANTLCELQQGLILSVSKLRVSLVDHIWRVGAGFGLTRVSRRDSVYSKGLIQSYPNRH